MGRVAVLLFLAAGVHAQILLEVRETAGVTRSEVLQSGIPLPRSLGVFSTNALAVVDANGVAVPAEFRVLARWNAGRGDASAPIQWLLVAFPATGGRTYRLITNGSVANPPPPVALRVERTGNRVTVDTGVATFVIEPSSLFEEIRLGTTTLARGDGSSTTVRSLTIDHAGPLTVAITVHAHANGFASQRRYVFTAGSGTAIVRQTVAWEGEDPRLVQRVRETLSLAIAPPFNVTIAGARGASALSGTATTASVHQQLRSSRTAPPRYELALNANTVAGAKADGALLAVSGGQGTLAVAFDHMHRYEPQALRLLDNGVLAIDIAADKTWLNERQGLFATFAIGALPSNASRAELERSVWAPLNHPLRAWPDASWFRSSGALDPVPPRTLPAQFADYDRAMRQVLARTLETTDSLGVHGLMTFGLYPRSWGDPLLSDEINCFGGDPTPAESWDDLYWCSTWTDYHNAAYTAAAHAMRTGEVQWLDELARPAALRQLFTQIYQCAPDDDYFYCGQAPAGYGGYRDDFNSSHAYFDNLMLHYWLTGDTTVVDTLQRGARSMRNYMCTRRPAAACQSTDPPVDEWANLTGRVASQWFLAFRFVGLASNDASYLDDWRANMARAVTQQYLALRESNTQYGFLLGGWQPVTNAGTHTTDQLWMSALYDLKNLEILRRDTNDAPIGNPSLRPSEIIAATARGFARFGGSSLAADWPNSLDVTWSGARVNGMILSVRGTPGGGDPLLYDTGKATLAGPLATAAMLTNDASLRALAEQAALLAINASINQDAPLGKIQAEYLARLHIAIAALSPPDAPPPPRRRAVGTR